MASSSVDVPETLDMRTMFRWRPRSITTLVSSKNRITGFRLAQAVGRLDLRLGSRPNSPRNHLPVFATPRGSPAPSPLESQALELPVRPYRPAAIPRELGCEPLGSRPIWRLHESFSLSFSFHCTTINALVSFNRLVSQLKDHASTGWFLELDFSSQNRFCQEDSPPGLNVFEDRLSLAGV